MGHRIIIGTVKHGEYADPEAINADITLEWSPPDSMSPADQKSQYGRVLKRYNQALHEMDPTKYPDPGD